MFFSVIIPTCNRLYELGKCLDLLAPGNQTLSKAYYEVIVTDDSRNDESAKLVANHYSWVHYVQGPKRGPAANRNNGAKQARGDWYIFLDDDCEPDKQILHEYKNAISLNMEIFVFEGSIEPGEKKTSPLEYGPFNTTGGHLWSCNFCIQAGVWDVMRGFDEVFKYPHLEDNDLRIRLQNVGYKIYFLRQAKVIHPWKKLTDGKRLGAFQEMSIYFFNKHKIPYSLFSMCLGIFKVHVGMMRNNLFSNELFKALWVMWVHIGVTVMNFRKWNTQYHN